MTVALPTFTLLLLSWIQIVLADVYVVTDD